MKMLNSAPAKSRSVIYGWLPSLLCLLVFSTAHAADAPAKPVLIVFAAASLTNALDEIGAEFEKSAGTPVKMSFDASSNMARQIEAGAHADVFFSADTQWMDYLQARDLIQVQTRKNIVGNNLVLIAPADSSLKLKIEPHFALAAALGDGRLATGDPDSVPVGRYAHSALAALGVWDEVVGRLARAENVRAALTYVAHGDAPLGIVYASDALVEKRVRVVDTFPASTHEPIVYPAAATKSARAEAVSFVSYLAGPRAHEIFLKYGFTQPAL
jgi:molybdate transport system substrate-binding protein